MKGRPDTPTTTTSFSNPPTPIQFNSVHFNSIQFYSKLFRHAWLLSKTYKNRWYSTDSRLFQFPWIQLNSTLFHLSSLSYHIKIMLERQWWINWFGEGGLGIGSRIPRPKFIFVYFLSSLCLFSQPVVGSFLHRHQTHTHCCDLLILTSRDTE